MILKVIQCIVDSKLIFIDFYIFFAFLTPRQTKNVPVYFYMNNYRISLKFLVNFSLCNICCYIAITDGC